MAKAIQLTQTGGPEVLELKELDLARAGSGQVLLKQEAIGVNFLDVTQRRGAVPIPLPGGLGLEGVGRVVAIGPDVSEIAVGDRVAYVLGPIGSYADERIYPADRLVKLPDAMSSEDAAALLFKGITAQYLIKSTYRVGDGTVVLVYGAAGGVGSILASWATHLGAKVIGVVSKEASVERARASGCAEVLVWGADLPAEVTRVTDGRLVDVVYDGVGKDTFTSSIESLKTRGTMVSIGASSGLPDPVSIPTLNSKSLFLTRPGLGAYATDVKEYRERAADVLNAATTGLIKPVIARRFPLDKAADAHRAIEAGGLDGAVVLQP